MKEIREVLDRDEAFKGADLRNYDEELQGSAADQVC